MGDDGNGCRSPPGEVSIRLFCDGGDDAASFEAFDGVFLVLLLEAMTQQNKLYF